MTHFDTEDQALKYRLAVGCNVGMNTSTYKNIINSVPFTGWKAISECCGWWPGITKT